MGKYWRNLFKQVDEEDEEGTEAAAASYLSYSSTSPSLRSRPPVKVFIADHPFLYVLADKK